jgi:hypothetical protein
MIQNLKRHLFRFLFLDQAKKKLKVRLKIH